MRELLLQALAEAKQLQATLNSMLSPDCSNVPSVEQILVWLTGQLERN